MGCFLTLEPVPGNARADAKRFGSLRVAGHTYDRLQPYSLADYFAGKEPLLPAMLDPYTGRPVYQRQLL